MDTLTQITLGAAVGEAVLGRHVGNKAILWGALCGTLPDLDVLIPMGDPVSDFTYHRGASHSLFVLALITPIIVWLIQKFHPRTTAFKVRWYFLVYLAFATHVLLDSFTVYGTQIFWPIYSTPMTWSTIFIIDPLYTLPMLAGVLAALLITRTSLRGHRLNSIGLVLSTSYLLWSLGVKHYVEHLAHESLERQQVNYERLLTTPAPFNTLLWRVVAMDQQGYYEGFYSLLDETPEIVVKHHPSHSMLISDFENHWPVQRLKWFTKGFYAVSQQRGDIIITDLRMGLEPDYVFSFKVGEIGNPHPVPSPAERRPMLRSFERLRWVWGRIWNA